MKSQLIWPWWVRISHWLVASGVFALWILSYLYYETDALHRWLGYAIWAVIVLRVLAACFTKWPTAKLTMPSKQQIMEHLQQLSALKLGPAYGHNPVGQLAVYLIWGLVSLLALTGWLAQTDRFWGEDWPVNMHAWLSGLLMAVVVLHVIGVFVVGRISRQNLILQMLHGKRHLFKTSDDDAS